MSSVPSPEHGSEEDVSPDTAWAWIPYAISFQGTPEAQPQVHMVPGPGKGYRPGQQEGHKGAAGRAAQS